MLPSSALFTVASFPLIKTFVLRKKKCFFNTAESLKHTYNGKICALKIALFNFSVKAHLHYVKIHAKLVGFKE